MEIVTAILIGAGNRGETYTNIMAKMDGRFKVAAEKARKTGTVVDLDTYTSGLLTNNL